MSSVQHESISTALATASALNVPASGKGILRLAQGIESAPGTNPSPRLTDDEKDRIAAEASNPRLRWVVIESIICDRMLAQLRHDREMVMRQLNAPSTPDHRQPFLADFEKKAAGVKVDHCPECGGELSDWEPLMVPAGERSETGEKPHPTDRERCCNDCTHREIDERE